ncbi:glycosyltransferase [Hymenobacter sp. YC55]|uniref:glycosyltransferase n=1 Tax=Hymenobacter sp. YC55 TaxID=3034019 RepID=UPI0023F7C21F|nr:glycosyltransferase [Hymenobacter sp. YC55]MDF7810191.1 glycosyltransferase [Hymenobacter sp. YC55]
MKGVSVIVCCHNSAARLGATIKHLANQNVSVAIPWEIIIVDNNSSDNTREKAEAEWQHYSLAVPFRVVDESTPGLSAAREKGIGEAVYDFLIFCDDDNWLDPSYVSNAYQLLHAHPQVAVVGGNNIGVFETPPPSWLPFFQHSYAIGTQGKLNFEILEGNQYIVGAGMAFRKTAYTSIKQKGFKFYLTDRIGNKVVGGGDVELCYIFKLAGYQIAYSSALTLQHYMPSGRMTKKYLASMWHQYSYSWLVFEAYKAVLGTTIDAKLFTEGHWKAVAKQNLVGELSILPQYLYSRLRDDIAYSLPHEAKVLYNYFLLRNSRMLVSIIRELHTKIA